MEEQRNEEILQLQIENESLRKKIINYEAQYEVIRKFQIAERSIASGKDFSFFKNNFIGAELLDELKKIDATIADLRRRQCEIAEEAIKQMHAYEKYTELCFMKDILSKPVTKLLLLLQTVEEGSASELLTVQFEGKIEEQNAEKILKAYYQKVSSLASSARNKNSFGAKFSLYLEDEATPKTEKERVKREMRDNTIRNIHRKYGSDMFQPEHMAELAANLRKMGININDISEKRIRQIIMRR